MIKKKVFPICQIKYPINTTTQYFHSTRQKIILDLSQPLFQFCEKPLQIEDNLMPTGSSSWLLQRFPDLFVRGISFERWWLGHGILVRLRSLSRRQLYLDIVGTITVRSYRSSLTVSSTLFITIMNKGPLYFSLFLENVIFILQRWWWPVCDIWQF